MQRAYPRALLTGGSTAGEIFGTRVEDDSLVVTAVELDSTRVAGVCLPISKEASYEAGKQVAQDLEAADLVHVFVLSEGLDVNGSDLVRGLVDHLPAGITATGGLSGDGDRFESTGVVFEGRLTSHRVAAVGFYGKNLRIGYGSMGGWDAFGPDRRITRSERNVLFEIDGKPALELFKRYLGEHAKGLPSTGLLFPLSLYTEADAEPVVRTILSIDEEANSITFAGDIPTGARARLMKANFERLVDGACRAAETNAVALGEIHAELAILISCVGRKLVLGQRIEEEVEAVRDVLGDDVPLAGFYSYGEISPFSPSARCELHNQTMTITTLAEVSD